MIYADFVTRMISLVLICRCSQRTLNSLASNCHSSMQVCVQNAVVSISMDSVGTTVNCVQMLKCCMIFIFICNQFTELEQIQVT